MIHLFCSWHDPNYLMKLSTERQVLYLLPVNAVLFPQGYLRLRVVDERYVRMIRKAQKTGDVFGVVMAEPQRQMSDTEQPTYESVGCTARLLSVTALEATQAIGQGLKIECIGLDRFNVRQTRLTSKGRIEARVAMIEPDRNILPTEVVIGSARALAQAIQSLRLRNECEVVEPFHFEHAGWIANRWSELLPISLKARQKLMELEDPQLRLSIVHQYLSQQQIVTG